jgi:Probable Zinc-ribbon domain
MADKPKKNAAKKAAIKRVVKRSLAQTHPKLAKEADGWDATTVTPGSDKKMPWVCSKGHTWQASVSNRANGTGFNDLASQYPDLAKELVGAEPTSINSGSNKSQKWLCAQGHYWEAKVSNRVRGSDCPYCAGNSVQKGFNDLATTHALLALEASGWDTTKFSSGSGLKKRWRCKEGHEWEAVIKSRVAGRGCPICANKKVLSGVNDLSKMQPALAMEAFNWEASTVVPHSNTKKTWKCPLGHVYSASPAARMRGNGCPICSGKKVLKGFNDLATKYPEIAEQAYQWDATSVTAHANKKVKWICPREHIYEMRIGNRTSLNQNCPICSNQQVLSGYNDLKTLHPDVARSAFNWDASKFLPFSHTKKQWRCEEGHIWKTSIAARARGQSCPTCSNSGYDVNSPAVLYLLIHEQWGLQKIGISNRETKRTQLHESRGWETLEVRGPMDGLLAYEWEQSILRMLKNHGAELGRDDIAGKFDGYTESWVADSFPVTSIKELMDLVHEDENK